MHSYWIFIVQYENDDHTSLASRVTTLETDFQTGCSTIAAAITAKGVTTASNASPSTMASNIASISTSSTVSIVSINPSMNGNNNNGLYIWITCTTTGYSAITLAMSGAVGYPKPSLSGASYLYFKSINTANMMVVGNFTSSTVTFSWTQYNTNWPTLGAFGITISS